MSKKLFSILGQTISPGQSAFLNMEVAKLHTRTPIQIPIIIQRAKKDGPTLLLLGGVHGDEVNGVAIVRKIIKEKINRPTKGTVICIPVFNIFGYLNLTREFPDGRDLNRIFPGSKNGSLASQFAYRFMTEIAPLADYIIDFHAGGADRANFPQVRCAETDKRALELAHIFNPPVILYSKLIPKTIRENLTKMNKCALLYEGGKSKDIDDEVIRVGVEGTSNVMIHLGMRNGTPKFSGTPAIVKNTKWMRANFSGMFHLKAINGSVVKKHDLLGIITDPYGEFERKVIAPFDCHIICVNTAPVVNKGDALFHISLPEEG
jgi:uncharacterized protein